MQRYSTREAAKKLGISHAVLAKYVAAGKLPAPQIIRQGNRLSHSWSEQDIENIRKLLPKIANGRKTRWQRQRAQAKKAVPGKSRKKEKPAK